MQKPIYKKLRDSILEEAEPTGSSSTLPALQRPPTTTDLPPKPTRVKKVKTWRDLGNEALE